MLIMEGSRGFQDVFARSKFPFKGTFDLEIHLTICKCRSAVELCSVSLKTK